VEARSAEWSQRRHLLPLSDQFLFLLNVIHRRDRRRQRLQLLLGSIPLALVDQLLHLGELLAGQHHGVFAGLLLFTEQHGAQPVEGVAGPGARDHRTEPTEAEHCGGDGPNDGERQAPAVPRCRSAVQRDDGVAWCQGGPQRRVANLVAPAGEQAGEFGLARVGRVHRLLRRERVDEAVGSIDLVERRVAPVCGPASEVRHGRAAPSR
jgi:hypothetical protein